MNLSLALDSEVHHFRSPNDALAWEFREREDGSYTSAGFQEDEFPLEQIVNFKFPKEKLYCIERNRLNCPSLDEALGKIPGVNVDREREVDLGQLRSSVWRELWWEYKAFNNRIFDWMRVAHTWRDIEALFLAGEEISELIEMIDRFNRTINVWLNIHYGVRK